MASDSISHLPISQEITIMKIGILTFHRAINYGAVLQCYALQETLKRLGHEVEVINYQQPRVERTDRKPFESGDKMRLLKGLHLRSWWNYDKDKAIVLERRSHFDDFLAKHFTLTEPCTLETVPQDFDAYVIGSDQVWNSHICDGLDPVFWGTFKHRPNSKIISIAASTSYKDITKFSRQEVESLLSNFDALSSREQEVVDYINKDLNVNSVAQVVLDPTLLANKEVWDGMLNDKYKDKKYVLYFAARTYQPNPSIIKQKATALANEMGCEVMTINFNEDTPEDFVSKFRYASAVVTSSFHGVAFSLIFNRNLYAIMYGDEQDARYVNVLKSIGAEKMLYEVTQDLLLEEFNFNKINSNLDKLQIESITYLKNVL